MIYLLRHGEAEGKGGEDAARELTPKGEQQARAAGQALQSLGERIETCLASPKVRAEATARLACESLGVEVEVEETLRGGAFDLLGLTAGRGSVLLVGHEPDFSAVVAQLTGANVKLRKGGIACIENSTLHALLSPKHLSAISGH